MWSSPACGLKQYIAQVSPNKGIRWTEEAEAAIGAYAEHQKMKPGDLELFKCVQVQCETQGPQDTLRESIHCMLCPGASFFGGYQRENLRRHIQTAHSASQTYPCPGCGAIYRRKDNLRRHVRLMHCVDEDPITVYPGPDLELAKRALKIP